MIVILNSDVLYTNGFEDKRLHKQWQRFADGCRTVNAELLFPRTALFEIELRQEELYEQRISQLTTAIELLKKAGVDTPFPAPDSLIGVPNVVALFAATGLVAKVEKATLEDFESAEFRAAKHLPPAPSRKVQVADQDIDDSDEMRDLVIWALACRVARANGGALLLSRDKVHYGVSGRAEAEECGLLRAFDFDEALGMLGAETESGKIAKAFLQSAWQDLVAGGVPVRADFNVKTITDPVFVQGEEGIASANFRFGTEVDAGTFFADCSISGVSVEGFNIELINAKINRANRPNGNFSARINKAVAHVQEDANERMEALKEILGES